MVRSLERLVGKAMSQKEPLWYPDASLDLSPQIEQALNEYVDLSAARFLAVIPLRQRPEPPTEERESAHNDEIIGAMVLEHFDAEVDTRRSAHVLADRLTPHAASAYHNALEHNGLFLYPLWKSLAKAMRYLRRHRLITAACLAGATALVCALVFVRVDFTVSADGTLEPLSKRLVFAEADGRVTAIQVDRGAQVWPATCS